MGFHCLVVCSGAVDAADKARILQQASARWPFIRPQRRSADWAAHALFAPPELTDYCHATAADYEAALAQAEDVEAGLADWSRRFPSVRFACIEADCFGGTCLYSGFACQDGAILAKIEADRRGHQTLLASIGVVIDDYFQPFERGYFGAQPIRA